MANWGTLANVSARLTYKTISSTSSPTDTQVTAWIEEAESFLSAALVAIGMGTTYTGNPARVLGKWAEDYAEGRVKQAWASANGNVDDTDGLALIDAFNQRIEDILDKPDRYGQLLGAGAGTTQTKLMRSHVLDQTDVADIAARFEKSLEPSEEF